MNWAAPYESAVRCTAGPEPGARALLAWALETYPQATSLGIYNCRNVAGTSTTSTHGEGRAVDVGLPMINGRGTPLGHSIVARIGEHGVRLGVQAIVYDRRVWSARSPAGRAYTGVHPHYDHLHIELTRQAARVLTLTTFRTVLGTGGFTMFAPAAFDDRNSDPVRMLQTYLRYTLNIDIGTFGPANDGVDGHYGGATARGLSQALATSGETRSFGHRQYAALLKRHHMGSSPLTVDAYTRAQSDVRFARTAHSHTASVNLT